MHAAEPQGHAARAEAVSITKRLINTLSAPGKGEGRVILWDQQVTGFGLRVYPTGRIVYVLQYRMRHKGAKTQTHTIGRHGSPWTPDAARDRARDLLEQVRRGIDPNDQARKAAEEAVERQAAEAAAALAAVEWTFDAFLDRYIELHVKAEELRSLKDIEGTFDRDVRPAFGNRFVFDITKQDVKDLRTVIGKRSRSAANKAHKWLNAAFMWGIENDGLTTSPMIGLKKPFKETKRKRVLVGWEIALVWSCLSELDWRFAMLDRLLLLTGQRLREVAGMRWSEVDLEKGEWVVPGSRTKNKLEHLVPLSAQTLRLLRAIEPDPEKRRGLVLTTNGRTPVSGFSKSKAQLDEEIAAAGQLPAWRRYDPMTAWVRHDYRRTLSTGFGELGIPLAHAEAVLNHVSGTLSGVAGTYWLYEYAVEKRKALDKWGAHVERILRKHKVPLLPE